MTSNLMSGSWTERRMLKLVLNAKFLLLSSFLTVAEFYNLRHIQCIIRVINLKEIMFSDL